MKSEISSVEYSTMAKGRLDVKVKFNTGKVYIVIFCDAAHIKSGLGKIGCFAVPGLIVLDEVSMERVHEVINHVVRSGFFNSLKPVEDDEDGE
jgi:hypothetical protein